MKRLCIFYHMSIDHSKPSDNYPHNIETAETCITIPMLDEMADDILEKQANSPYVKSFGTRDITNLLSELARVQGYTDAAFVMAEEATLTDAI